LFVSTLGEQQFRRDRLACVARRVQRGVSCVISRVHATCSALELKQQLDQGMMPVAARVLQGGASVVVCPRHVSTSTTLLTGQPLVAGAWGELTEASSNCCVASWSGKSATAVEAPTESAASQHGNDVRRHISIAVAKANAECLCKILDNPDNHIDPNAAGLASASRQQDPQRIYNESHEELDKKCGIGVPE